MNQQLFVNLAVKNLDQSVTFFKAFGFDFNPQFTDENATCMVIAENIQVMLLTETYFQTFTPKKLCDAKSTTEVLTALNRESRGKVDELVAKAVAAGGRTYAEPKDYGFMYQHGFEDLDGHLWEIFWMDPAGLPKDA